MKTLIGPEHSLTIQQCVKLINMITQFKQQIMGYHVKFKVYMVSKALLSWASWKNRIKDHWIKDQGSVQNDSNK